VAPTAFRPLEPIAAGPVGDRTQARQTPQAPPCPRLRLFACATRDSGVPAAWAAGPGRPGIALLPRLDDAAARADFRRLLGGALHDNGHALRLLNRLPGP
jgi:hypothetical protein